MAAPYDFTVRRALDIVAAAAADRTGAAFDMQDHDAVLVLVLFDTIAAGATPKLKLQQAVDSAFTTPLDLAGTSWTVADDDDDKVFAYALIRPTKQYVRVYVDKDGTNNTVEGAIYVGIPKLAPADNTATASLKGLKEFVSPAEGTA